MQRMVADFYGVPRNRLGDLHVAAKGSWARIGRNRERWTAFLTLGVIGDTPLPGGEEVLGDGTPASFICLRPRLLLCATSGRGSVVRAKHDIRYHLTA